MELVNSNLAEMIKPGITNAHQQNAECQSFPDEDKLKKEKEELRTKNLSIY